MKLLAFAGLGLLLTASAAHANGLSFEYACKSHRYIGNQEVATAAPDVASYAFVKIAKPKADRKPGEAKWANSFLFV